MTIILRVRNEFNLSSSYVAEFLKISLDQLAEIELGFVIPDSHLLDKLVELYGCSKKYLLSTSMMQPVIKTSADISEFDSQQLQGFLEFQRVLSISLIN